MVRNMIWFLAVLLGFTGHAAIACEPEFRSTSVNDIINYDGFGGAQRIENISITIANNGNTACVGRLIPGMQMLPRALVSANNQNLQFDILSAGNQNRVLYDPQTNFAEPLNIRIPPRRSEQITLRVRIAGGQKVQAGRYTGVISLNLEPGPQADNPGQGSPVNWPSISQPLTLAATILPRIQANLTGVDSSSANGQVGSISFGELTSGEQRNLGIQIRANTDVVISVQSVNRGVLQHIDDEAARIPYALSILGQPIDLSAESRIHGQYSITGVTNPMLIRIGSTDGARSGQYSDQIIFTISGP